MNGSVAMMNQRGRMKWAKVLILFLGFCCWTAAPINAQDDLVFNLTDEVGAVGGGAELQTDSPETSTEWVTTTTEVPSTTTTKTIRPRPTTSGRPVTSASKPIRIRPKTTTAPTTTTAETTTTSSTTAPSAQGADFKPRILQTADGGAPEEDLAVSSILPPSSTTATLLDNRVSNDWTPIVRPSSRVPVEPSVLPTQSSSTTGTTNTRIVIRPTPLLRPLPTIVAAPARIRPASSTAPTPTSVVNNTVEPSSPPTPLVVRFDIEDAALPPPSNNPSGVLFPDDAVFFPPQFVDDQNSTSNATAQQPDISNPTTPLPSSVAPTTAPTVEAITTKKKSTTTTTTTTTTTAPPIIVTTEAQSNLNATGNSTVVEPAGLPTNRSEPAPDVVSLSPVDVEVPAPTDGDAIAEVGPTTDGTLLGEPVNTTEEAVPTTSLRGAMISTASTTAAPTTTNSSEPPSATTSPTEEASVPAETGRATTLSGLAGLPTLFPALTRVPSTTIAPVLFTDATTVTSTTKASTTTTTTPSTTAPSPTPSVDVQSFGPSTHLFHPPSPTVEQDTPIVFPNDPSTTEFYPIDDWSSTEGSTQDPGAMNTTIVAVSVSVSLILCLALMLLLFLVLRRRRARAVQGTCQPARMDAYSLDNVSQNGSSWNRGGKLGRSSLRASKRSYLNQAFDDSAAFSVPLTAAQLALYMEKPITSIEAEFRNVATTSTVRIEELPAGVESKNRYANVLPIPETRVHIRMTDNEPLDTAEQYINANYIKGPKDEPRYYIGCQGPMDETVEDFWQMIWENQCKVIVQLTDLSENGVTRCAEYLPPSEVLDCHRLYGDYQVTLKSRELRDNYVTSHVQLKRMEDNLVREITHFWYSSWPATGVPDDAKTIVALLLEARKGQPKEAGCQAPPIVVHCSPGTGRTGAVLAIDVCLRQLDSSRAIDIPRCVHRLRQDRAGCVQTGEQYAFIYRAVNYYASQLSNGALDSL